MAKRKPWTPTECPFDDSDLELVFEKIDFLRWRIKTLTGRLQTEQTVSIVALLNNELAWMERLRDRLSVGHEIIVDMNTREGGNN